MVNITYCQCSSFHAKQSNATAEHGDAAAAGASGSAGETHVGGGPLSRGSAEQGTRRLRSGTAFNSPGEHMSSSAAAASEPFAGWELACHASVTQNLVQATCDVSSLHFADAELSPRLQLNTQRAGDMLHNPRRGASAAQSSASPPQASAQPAAAGVPQAADSRHQDANGQALGSASPDAAAPAGRRQVGRRAAAVAAAAQIATQQQPRPSSRSSGAQPTGQPAAAQQHRSGDNGE